MKFDAVLLDFDGTLADSMESILVCIKHALDGVGIPYTEEQLKKMVGPPFRVAMREMYGVTDEERVERLIKIYRTEYEHDGWHCELFAGIEDMLSALRAHGVRLAVATSKPLKFTNQIVDGLDLRKYFDFVGGAESDNSRDSKADVIEYVLAALAPIDRSRVLMVGDRLYDIDGAKRTGVASAGVLWGYGDRAELEAHGADYIVDKPEDIVSLVLGD